MQNWRNTKLIPDMEKGANKVLVQLEDLDLASLISSRICHDVISPVGAISNGLEVLDEENDEEVREYAMDLIRRSAEQASAKLQFARLAFGAGGSAGTEIGLTTLQPIAEGILDSEKYDINWDVSLSSLTKDKAKLLLNIVAIALTTLPRGGSIAAIIAGSKEKPSIELKCSGRGVRMPEALVNIISGATNQVLDTQSIQSYYANRLAKESNMNIKLSENEGIITIKAVSN